MSDESKHWTHSFFGGAEDFYGRTYTRTGVFEKKDTEKEINGIISLLNPEPNSHILDWCGGWGRHAVPLAKRGYKITLLDFSREYLSRAAKYAEQEGVLLTLIHSDLRKTPENIQADYAVNLFTAGLGYLGEDQDTVALKALFTSLRLRAKILIDTASLFWIAKNFKSDNWTDTVDGKGRFLQRRTFDFWRNSDLTEHIFEDREKQTEETRNTDLKTYCPADLSRILKLAGFTPLNMFGDFDGSVFNFDSKRLVMTARKE